MTPIEANAILYEVTQGRPDASSILFALFDENPNVCMELIRAIHRSQKCGRVWVRMFQMHHNPHNPHNPSKLLKQL